MGTLSKYSVLLDGSNEYVEIGNVAALDFDYLDAFSVSAWIRLNSNGAYVIASKMAASSTYRGWALETASGPSLQFSMYNDFTGGNRMSVRTTSIIPAGASQSYYSTWHHVVMTKTSGSSAASSVKLYIDGVEITSKTVNFDTLTATTLNTASAQIGRRSDGSALYFNGNLDDVAVYNKELSAAEVTTIFNSYDPPDLTVTGPTANLVGYWKLGDGDTYPTATDSSASGNNGTYTNTESSDIEPYAPLQNPMELNGFSGSEASIYSPAQYIFSGAAGVKFLYKMRGQDDGAAPPGYVTWVATFPDYLGVESASSIPAIVGTLVPGSVVEVSRWVRP